MVCRFFVGLVIGCAWCVSSATTLAGDKPEIVSNQMIWNQGKHNAFTDLIRWRDTWYCTFRESDAHVGGDGKIRVLESPDGKAWKSAALLVEDGIDLRDPKLSVTPKDQLMLVMGGSVYHGGRTLLGRQPRVAFSSDGRTWTVAQRVLGEGDWLWRVTWHKGRAYGTSYRLPKRPDAGKIAATRESGKSDPSDWKLDLLVSDDGIHYESITRLDVPGHPNETTLRFLADDEMVALVRRETGNGWIGVSRPPYRDWKWHETGYRFGGPNCIVLPAGSMWAAGRCHLPGGTKTILARMGAEAYEPVLTLPSGGDTSYPGLVWHDNLLWMSYYASHEGKSSIYLATIRLPEGSH